MMIIHRRFAKPLLCLTALLIWAGCAAVGPQPAVKATAAKSETPPSPR
jgi:hypothetical protein